MNGLGFPVAAVVTAATTILSLVLGNKTQSKQSAQSTQSTQNTQSTQAPQQKERVIVVMQKEKNYTKYIAIAASLVIGYVILNDKK